MDLFESTSEDVASVDMPGATLRYVSNFLTNSQADHYFKALLGETQWREEDVFVWGKWHKQPRLVAWYGDLGAKYTYSGRTLTPERWTSTLLELKRSIEEASNAEYNSVLLNLYRDHNDGMGWHSDNEPELGGEPTIASLSLGDSREFLFKHRVEKSLGIKRITLAHGSLLIMSGATQRNWMHAIEKEKKPCGKRINLTFRFIYSKQRQRS